MQDRKKEIETKLNGIHTQMAEFLSIIILNVNRLNILLKGRNQNWKEKQNRIKIIHNNSILNIKKYVFQWYFLLKKTSIENIEEGFNSK